MVVCDRRQGSSSEAQSPFVTVQAPLEAGCRGAPHSTLARIESQQSQHLPAPDSPLEWDAHSKALDFAVGFQQQDAAAAGRDTAYWPRPAAAPSSQAHSGTMDSAADWSPTPQPIRLMPLSSGWELSGAYSCGEQQAAVLQAQQQQQQQPVLGAISPVEPAGMHQPVCRLGVQLQEQFSGIARGSLPQHGSHPQRHAAGVPLQLSRLRGASHDGVLSSQHSQQLLGQQGSGRRLRGSLSKLVSWASSAQAPWMLGGRSRQPSTPAPTPVPLPSGTIAGQRSAASPPRLGPSRLQQLQQQPQQPDIQQVFAAMPAVQPRASVSGAANGPASPLGAFVSPRSSVCSAASLATCSNIWTSDPGEASSSFGGSRFSLEVPPAALLYASSPGDAARAGAPSSSLSCPSSPCKAADGVSPPHAFRCASEASPVRLPGASSAGRAGSCSRRGAGGSQPIRISPRPAHGRRHYHCSSHHAHCHAHLHQKPGGAGSIGQSGSLRTALQNLEMAASIKASRLRDKISTGLQRLTSYRLADGVPTKQPVGREVLHDWEFGPELGAGATCVTRLVMDRSSARACACKTINKAGLFRSAAIKAAILGVQREVAILQHTVGHPNIVQLQAVYEDVRALHMVLEWCGGGSLGQLLDRAPRRVLGEAPAAAVMKAVLCVLAHCHARGVMHRDIKPDNLLIIKPLDDPCQLTPELVKVTDFGISLPVTPGKPLAELAGTLDYMAPEVLRRAYDQAADVWSAGVMLHELLTGGVPFAADSPEQLLRTIETTELSFAGPEWAGVSCEARQLVGLMLLKDASIRPSAAQLLASFAGWLELGSRAAAP